MLILKMIAAWLKAYGLILAWLVYTVTFIFSLVLVFRIVDEVLSIAQRGYFISVPTEGKKGIKTPSRPNRFKDTD
jgi:hypothetical protein